MKIHPINVERFQSGLTSLNFLLYDFDFAFIILVILGVFSILFLPSMYYMCYCAVVLYYVLLPFIPLILYTCTFQMYFPPGKHFRSTPAVKMYLTWLDVILWLILFFCQSKPREKEVKSEREVQLEHRRYVQHSYIFTFNNLMRFCLRLCTVRADNLIKTFTWRTLRLQMKDFLLSGNEETWPKMDSTRLTVCFVHRFGIKPVQAGRLGEC